MKASISVRKDDTFEDLLFASEEDAQHFIKFIEHYVNESGASNGYGAYWIFDKQIELTNGNSKRFVKDLEFSRLLDMAKSVALARSGGDDFITLPSITYGHREDAITFNFWGFEPSQVPKPGDMYRVVDWTMIEGHHPGEGHVVEIKGDIALCASYADEWCGKEPDGPLPTIETPLAAIMKIPDWLKAHKEKKVFRSF